MANDEDSQSPPHHLKLLSDVGGCLAFITRLMDLVLHSSGDSVSLMGLYSIFLSAIYFPLVDFMGIHSK